MICETYSINYRNLEQKSVGRAPEKQSTKNKRRRQAWSNQETLKYLEFLEENRSILADKDKRNKQNVFNRMSEYVKTRQSRKCKSHHQKLIQKYKNIDRIIIKLNKSFETQITESNLRQERSEIGLQKGEIQTMDFKKAGQNSEQKIAKLSQENVDKMLMVKYIDFEENISLFLDLEV